MLSVSISSKHVAGFINWTNYFGDAFKRVNRTISDDEKIIVYAPDYMHNLTRLIQAHLNDSVLQRDLENYMTWQLVKSLRNSLSKKYRDAGRKKERQRWTFLPFSPLTIYMCFR